LWGYRDRSVEKLSVNLDRVFDPRCLPITKRHKEGAKSAIIMVHGFPSTPYSFTYAAQRGYEAGYDVYVPLLPGFGTAVEDLYDTTFTQWYNYLKELFLEKRGEYDHLYVLGTSMGGAMTLRLGEEMQGNNAPDGLVTVAAPVFLQRPPLRGCSKLALLLYEDSGALHPCLIPYYL
jgi:carboxylesterase